MFETSNEQQSQSSVIVVSNSTVVVGSMNTSISTTNATNHDTVNSSLISDEIDNHLNHHSCHHHNGHINLLSSYYYCKNLIDFPQFHHHHHSHYNINSNRCASNTCSSQHTTNCSNTSLIESSHLESTSTATTCTHKRFNTMKSTDSNLISLCTDEDLLNDSLTLSAANAASRTTSTTNTSETNNLDENSECSDDSTSACSSSSSTTNSLNSCCGHESIINPCNVSSFDCIAVDNHLTSMNELNSNYETSKHFQSNTHEQIKINKENNDEQTDDHEEEVQEDENESDSSIIALIKPSLSTENDMKSSNKTQRRRLGLINLKRPKMKPLDKNNISIRKSTSNKTLSRVKKLINYAKFQLNLNLFTKMSSSKCYDQLNNTNNLSESIISNVSNEQTSPLSSNSTSTSNKFSTLKEKLSNKLRIKRKYSLLSANNNNNQISKHRKVNLKSMKKMSTQMCNSVLNDKSDDLNCTFKKFESKSEYNFVDPNQIVDNDDDEEEENVQQHDQNEPMSSISSPPQSTTSISSQIILTSSLPNPSSSCLPSSSCSPSTSSQFYYFKTDNLTTTTTSPTATSSSSSSSSSSTPTNLNEFISDPFFYNSNNSQNVLVSQTYEQTSVNGNNSTNSTQQHFIYDIEMMPINQQSIDEINRTNSSSIYSFMINYPNNQTMLNNNTNSSSTGSNSQVKQDLLKMSYDKFKQFRLNEKLLPQTVLIRNAIKMLQYDIQEQESIIFMQNQQHQQQQQQQHMRFQQQQDQQNFLNQQLQQQQYLNSQDNQPQMQYETSNNSNNLVNYSNCNGANSNNSMMMMNMNTYENLDEFLSRSEYFNGTTNTSHSLSSPSNSNSFTNQRTNNSSNVIRLTRLANKDSTDSIGCYYINTDTQSQITHQHHNETVEYEQAMNGEEVDVVCEHLEDDEIEDEEEQEDEEEENDDDDDEEEEEENEDEEADEGDEEDDEGDEEDDEGDEEDDEGDEEDDDDHDDEGNEGLDENHQNEENNQNHDHEEHDENENDQEEQNQGNDPNSTDNQNSHSNLNNNAVTMNEYEQINEANLVNTNRNRNVAICCNHLEHSDENKENKFITSEFMDAILLSTSTVYVCESDKKYYMNDKYSTVTNNITNNHSLLLFKENENRLNEIVDLLQFNLDNSNQNELHDHHNHFQQSADMFFGQSQLNDELMFDL